MKNTKSTLVSMIAIATTLCCSQITADDNFAIWNKTNTQIKVSVMGNELFIPVDTNESYYATVTPNKEGKIVLVISSEGKFQWKYTLTPNGKTMYLSWDTNKSQPLYPQTGALMGLMGRYNPLGQGKNKHGFPLNNNISEKQIAGEKVITPVTVYL